MEGLKICTLTILLMSSVIISSITMIQFTRFVSEIKHTNNTIDMSTKIGNIPEWSEIKLAFFIDFSLLSLFILQHSAGILFLKKLMGFLQMEELERSIFNASSAIALQVMMNYWRPIIGLPIWSIDVFASYHLWLLFSWTQCMGWIITYIDCIVMDLPFLLGIKQLYYALSGRPCPLLLRSKEFKSLASGYPHSLLGFFIVIWAYPHMSLDRCIMGLTLTVYMYISFGFDEFHYKYMRTQDEKKSQ